jgi:LacI family transcriptional regulator
MQMIQRQNRAKSTVSDVAAKAGVSVATVSRAFNLPDVVSQDVRVHVLDVARKMGYSPNPAAKALRLQKSHIVGAVIPTLDYAIFARMIDSFQETLSASDYMTIVLTTGFDNSNVFDKVKLLVDRGAEALLIVGSVEDPKLRRYLKFTHIPVVSTYSFHAKEIVPSIGFDNYAAEKTAVDHLIDLGHKHFVLIAGSPSGNDRQRARIQAYKDTIEKSRCTGADAIMIRKFTILDGVSTMREIREKFPKATAIVCTTDVIAFGVLSECRKLNIRIPEDISVVGFDDAEYAALLDPPLTTMVVPASEMGIKAANALKGALMKNHKPRSEKLETHLELRSSTAKPKSM